jgi:anti-sigma factor RsiW
VNERYTHPTSERLEAFVEGILDEGDRAVVASHLLACPRCEGEVEEWRSLFAVLRSLPSFVPEPGFATRVMAHVRIPAPWHARASGFFSRFIPRTTGGWAVAAALLAIPVLTGVSFMAWLLSKSYVTANGLWVFATGQFSSVAGRTARGLFDGLLETSVAAWVARGLDAAQSAGVREVGVLAVGGALLTIVSAWVLYRYLFRPSNGNSNHVTFSH